MPNIHWPAKWRQCRAVDEFLRDLAEHARAPAEQEVAELKAIAAKDGITELKPWDSSYYSEKLKMQQFNLSQESLKPYFPAPKICKVCSVS